MSQRGHGRSGQMVGMGQNMPHGRRWVMPVADPPCGAKPPLIQKGVGDDPGVQARGQMPLSMGSGSKYTWANQAQVRYLAQTWDGSKVLHNTWESGVGTTESLGDDPVGVFLRAALEGSPQGTILELVAGPTALNLSADGAVVIVVELVQFQ
jgi:hypothetical protein